MNHLKTGRKFGRNSSHRKAMMQNLAVALIEHEQVKTSLAKAKEIRGFVEPLITRSADNSLATRRYLIDRLRTKDAVNKLLNDLGPRYSTRPGGYIRVLKCGHRAGDNAPMAILQLVPEAYEGMPRQALTAKAAVSTAKDAEKASEAEASKEEAKAGQAPAEESKAEAAPELDAKADEAPSAEKASDDASKDETKDS